MSKERAIRFTKDEDVINNRIPIDVEATLGQVFYSSERDPKRVRGEGGQYTDEISALQIECVSEKQETTFNVDLPPDFDLEGLKLQPWDEIELEGVEYVEPWAILPSGAFNPYDAMMGYSVKAKAIKKVGAASSTNSNKKSDMPPIPNKD